MNQQLMLVLVCVAFAPRASHPQAAGNTGAKVVIRNTFAGHSTDNTTYSMADRKRTEFPRASQRTKEDGSVEWDETTIVHIVPCDLGQGFSLNTKTEEYSVAEYPPKPLTPGEMAAHGLDTAIAPVEVQTDTLQMFLDHGAHTSITSPVR